MSNQLQGRKVAILAADGVEKVELERPRAAVEGAGGQVQLLSLKTGEIQAREHDLEPAGTFPVDRAVADASVDEFDALVLPGRTVSTTQSGRRRVSTVISLGAKTRKGGPQNPVPRLV